MRRYTVVIADRSSGTIRTLTVSLRMTLLVVVALLTVPLLIGVGGVRSARVEVGTLRASQARLEVENGSFRAATGEFATQIQSLEDVIEQLGADASVGPSRARALTQLPAVVKTKAVGGNAQANAAIARVPLPQAFPGDAFGVLRDVLESLQSRLRYVRRDVEQQEKLAAATPSIWPAHGWLTATFGQRMDPFTGEPGFHQGIDISTKEGDPVFATADGTVELASASGDYGNLIVLRHDFGLATRYGHLKAFKVTPGQSVRRGEVIGFVGTTGRSTGAHLHYEILINGALLNPLELLTQPATR